MITKRGLVSSKEKSAHLTSPKEDNFDSNYKSMSIQAVYQMDITILNSYSGSANIAHGRKKPPMFLAYTAYSTIPLTTVTNWLFGTESYWESPSSNLRMNVSVDATNITFYGEGLYGGLEPPDNIYVRAMVFVYTNDLE